MANTYFTPTEDNHVVNDVYKTAISGLLFISSTRFQDQRGHFAELLKLPEIAPALDQPFCPVQINHAHSKRNVIRGFHAEHWNKLITIVYGRCLCVLADVRPDSPTFGDTVTVELGNNGSSLYGSLFLPIGIANSALALSDGVEYLYLVDRLYKDRDTAGDVAISLFDPDLNVDWPISHDNLIISSRDRNAISLRKKFPDAFATPKSKS